jgi:hypothetical protein
MFDPANSFQFIVALITPRMLKSITFGTFYFFLGKLSGRTFYSSYTHRSTVFCIILVVWVYFCVPETKGRRIEEMDEVFGGNQGVEDMRRIADIRRRLGITVSSESASDKPGSDIEDKGANIEVSHHEA